MKKRKIKFLITLVTAVFVSTSLQVQNVSAFENKDMVKQKHNISYTEKCNLEVDVQGKDVQTTEDVAHAANKTLRSNTKPKTVKTPNYKQSSRNNEDRKYSMAQLNSMHYDELVKTISTLSWSDITDLFQYNEDAVKFYSDTKRMDYLINALKDKGSKFTKEDGLGIPTIVEVVRAGFYLGFYNDGLKELNTRAYHDKCIPAILSAQKNLNFKLGTRTQDEVVAAIGMLVNNGSSNVEIVNNFSAILNQYKNDFDTFIKDSAKGKAIYNIIDGVSYDIEKYAYEKRDNSGNTPWSGKIDGFINCISYFALKGNVNTDNAWLINNSLYYIGKLGNIHSNKKEGLRVLTEAMKVYPYLSEQYLQCAASIADRYESKDYYGQNIDFNKIKQDGLKKYLPKTHNFDDGKVIIKTGDKVSEEKIKRVYWASKEVQAQFFRALGSDKALEQGNKDDVLTIVIYNSPKEYEMNRLLNGLDVKNGGIYIEGDGTFYTYERTENESIYTLEELFRHEFTHYLQGRYLVPGQWGSSKIYENGRLTWLEEGGAELFAGSTRTNDILPRKSVVSNIVSTPEANRYTADKIMHSQYGSFDFYHYSFVLQDYMYANDFTKLNELFQAIKANDVNKYDELINRYSKDSSLEANYKNYMQQLINKYDGLTTPLVSDDYTMDHKTKNAKEVYADITKVANLQNVNTEVEKSQFFNTFTLRGNYNAGKSQGKLNDLKNIGKKLNEFLNTLSSYSWTGYKTVTAYMVNYNVDKNNNVTWELVFRGELKDGATENPGVNPVVNIKAPLNGKENEDITFNSEVALDTNRKVAEYLWDFGDGVTSKDANPIHKYSKPGVYNVSLKVTDDAGLSGTKDFKVLIEESAVVNPTENQESEPNDSFAKANGPLLQNSLMNGKLTKDDNDIFYIDVLEDGKVDINLKNNGNIGTNWLVYKASDTNNYIAYATDVNNNELKGSFNATKGKYYIMVYGYSEGKSNYSLNVKGNIGQKPNKNIIIEKEDNNDFSKANSISIKDTIVKGSLNGNDNMDIYCFDVTTEGTADIVLTNNSKNLGVAWNLYNEKDLNNYVAYSFKDGNRLYNKVKLKPGKYYLAVYKYAGDGDYSVESRFAN